MRFAHVWLSTQSGLSNAQCPKLTVDAHAELESHTLDAAHSKNKEKRNKNVPDKRNQNKEKPKEESDKKPTMSFHMIKKKNLCCCCGKTHAFTDCPNKATTPRNKWCINKVKNHNSGQVQCKPVTLFVIQSLTGLKLEPDDSFTTADVTQVICCTYEVLACQQRHKLKSFSNLKVTPVGTRP